MMCAGISEHRNIPVEDAFALLSTSLQRYQQQQQQLGGGGGGREGREGRNPLMEQADNTSIRNRGGMQLAGPPLPDPVHPASMQALIHLLQENRPMTVLEYDRLIRYLSDRRDRQMAMEDTRGGGGGGGGGSGIGLAGSQPAYLQGKKKKSNNNHQVVWF